MRAFVLLALVAFASGSAPTGGSGYDECPTAPAKPSDRRRGDPRTFTLAVQRVSAPSLGEARDGSSNDTRLERVAADIVAFDADFVHMTGVADCAALNGVVAASTAIDARVAGDYRPYLVAPETVSGGGFPAIGAMLTRVDPTANVYLASGSGRGAESEEGGPPPFPHYFARTRLGRVDVVVAGVASATSPDVVRRGSTESWASEVLKIVSRGEGVIVVADDPAFFQEHPRVSSFLLKNAFRMEDPTSAFGGTVWTSPLVTAALREGKTRPDPQGAGSTSTSRAGKTRLEFKPGAFTNEAETVAEYLTPRTVFLTACEVAFAAAFFPGIVAVAFPERRARREENENRKTARRAKTSVVGARRPPRASEK